MGISLLAAEAAADEAPYKAGRVVERMTEGGVAYAVYAPEKWRQKRPSPLVLHVPHAKFMPADILRVPYVTKEIESQCQQDGWRTLHATVLLEAHNKENATQKEEIDPHRFATLLDRDAAAVAAVIEHMGAEVPIQRDAVVIRGSNNCAEVALGIATRRPGLFAAVVLKDMNITARMKVNGNAVWKAIPQGEALQPALGLPVVVTWDPGEPNSESRTRIHHEVRDLLHQYDFRRVELIPGIPGDSYRRHMNPESMSRVAEIIVENRNRAERAAERDEVLDEARKDLARDRLSTAIRKYREALAQETEHGLDAASDAFYAELEKRGRERLDAANALSPAKRKAEYRKVRRLFEGTPLEAEIRKALSEI